MQGSAVSSSILTGTIMGVLGNFGGSLEYRFTPHIGIFSEAGYEVVDESKNNFMQVNFLIVAGFFPLVFLGLVNVNGWSGLTQKLL
jgi:hypothetical protein